MANELSKLAAALRARRIEATTRLEKILADATAGQPADLAEVEALLPVAEWTVEAVEERARANSFQRKVNYIPGFSLPGGM